LVESEARLVWNHDPIPLFVPRNEEMPRVERSDLLLLVLATLVSTAFGVVVVVVGCSVVVGLGVVVVCALWVTTAAATTFLADVVASTEEVSSASQSSSSAAADEVGAAVVFAETTRTTGLVVLGAVLEVMSALDEEEEVAVRRLKKRVSDQTLFKQRDRPKQLTPSDTVIVAGPQVEAILVDLRVHRVKVVQTQTTRDGGDGAVAAVAPGNVIPPSASLRGR
jgi:hypothetical protein